MNRARTLFSSLSLLGVAACGTGGGGGTPSPTPTNTCFYNTVGQVLSLSASQITGLNETVARTGTAQVGLQISVTAINMTITTPPAGTVLLPNEAIVVIDTGINVTQNKGIHPKNVCSGIEAVLMKQANARGAISMRITKGVGSSGYDTVEFHQPGFAGVWTQIGEFLPSSFWGVAAGHVVTFTWLTD